MKLILIFLTSLMTFAHAEFQEADLEGLSATQELDGLVALDCPGAQQPQLREAFEWRRQGDVHTATSVGEIKARGRRISVMSTFVFADEGGNGSTKNIKMLTNGHIVSGNLASTLYGCKVLPLAMNVSQLGSRSRYFVDQNVFDRLSVVDQFIARTLLRGFKAEAIRTLLDERVPNLPAAVLVARLQTEGFTFVFYRGFDLRLNDKTLTMKGDVVLTGRHYSANAYEYSDVIFDEQARLLAVSNPQVLMPSVWTDSNTPLEEVSGTNNCSSAWAVYRPTDRTLAYCGVSFINPAGGQLGQGRMVFADRGEYLNLYEDSVKGNFVFADLTPKADRAEANYQLGIYTYASEKPYQVSSIRFLAGEPGCSGEAKFVSSDKSSEKNGDIYYHFTAPKGCIGVYEIVWTRGRELIQTPPAKKPGKPKKGKP
jgi:hypothetical protein